MIHVSWAIQAHPRRSLTARALAASIGGPVDVAWDPEPDSTIKSPWRTFRHLLETTPAGASHRAQIQDDATVHPALRSAVELAVAARPDRLLVLYVGGNPHAHADAVRRACRNGECWARLDPAHWLPCVSTVWPVEMIGPLLEYVDAQHWPPEFGGDDEIIGRWIRSAGVQPLAVVPSLVQHLDVADSLKRKVIIPGPRPPVKLPDPGRTAALYVGNCSECEPLAWDWGSGLHDFPDTT